MHKGFACKTGQNTRTVEKNDITIHSREIETLHRVLFKELDSNN